MADTDKLVEQLSGLTVLEIAGLVKQLEEKWGVSAAAPVAVAAGAAAAGAGGGAAAAPAEEKSTKTQCQKVNHQRREADELEAPIPSVQAR